MVKAGLAIAYV